MLETLADLKQDEALAVLSAAAARLIEASADDPLRRDVDPERVASVIVEIAKNTNTRLGGQKDRYYQLRYLSDEMSRVLFPSDSGQRAAASRLGAKGELRPSLYRVTFTEPYKEFQINLPEAMAMQCVRQADSWQHIEPSETEVPNAEPLSLFVRTLPATTDGDRCTVLVIASRREDQLAVSAAVRLFHSEIDLPAVATPYDLLKAFTDRYGVPFSIADSAPTKLLYFLRIDVPLDKRHDFAFEAMRLHANTPRVLSFSLIRADSDPKGNLRSISVGIAFAIDVDAYKTSIRRHGIQR